MSQYTNLFNGGFTHEYHVFYKGKYQGDFSQFYITKNKDLYDHAFVYDTRDKVLFDVLVHSKWWRMDGTPCLKEQIPKEYLALALLIPN